MYYTYLCVCLSLWTMRGKDFIFVAPVSQCLIHGGCSFRCLLYEWIMHLPHFKPHYALLWNGDIKAYLRGEMWNEISAIAYSFNNSVCTLLLPPARHCAGRLGNRQGQRGNKTLALGTLSSSWGSYFDKVHEETRRHILLCISLLWRKKLKEKNLVLSHIAGGGSDPNLLIPNPVSFHYALFSLPAPRSLQSTQITIIKGRKNKHPNTSKICVWMYRAIWVYV